MCSVGDGGTGGEVHGEEQGMSSSQKEKEKTDPPEQTGRRRASVYLMLKACV